MVSDTTADFLTRLQNAVMRKSEEVEVPVTKAVISILEILKREKLIKGYAKLDTIATVELAYDEGYPVVSKFQKVSKPGQRIYVSAQEIKPVLNGRGISIISTSQGLMAGAVAKSKSLGGEYICKIW